MPQGIAIQRRCCCFGTEKKGSLDLRSGRSKCKYGGDATPVGNPASGDDRNSDSVDDLWHQRQCTRLRSDRTIEVRCKESPPMSAGFRALSDDGINATSFQPKSLLDGRRRGHHAGTRGLDPCQQSRVRQAKMETHRFGLGVLNDPAHGIAERCDIETGQRRLVVNPKLNIIWRQPLMPSVLAADVGFRLNMAKEVDVDRLARQPPQLLNCCRNKLRLQWCATDRAQATCLADGSCQFDRAKPGHRRLDKRVLDLEKVNQPTVWPHRDSP